MTAEPAIRPHRLVALALLALLAPPAFAGPPEGVSGRMVLDEMADRLRKCRSVKDVDERLRRLLLLAPSRDIRVAVALGDELDGWLAEKQPSPYDSRVIMATIILYAHYLPPDAAEGPKRAAIEWWKKNGDDLRRRAKQLPR